MTIDQFRDMLTTHCLPRGGRGLADAILSVDEESQLDALTEALEWLRVEWRTEAALEAVNQLPPFMISRAVEGNTDDFAGLLFPPGHGRRPGAYKAEFWEWQKRQASTISRKLHPERAKWRVKWFERCREDPAWKPAVAELGRLYADIVAFAESASPPPAREWERFQSQTELALLGTPDCGHMQPRVPCVGCDLRSFAAWEAHEGWWHAVAWKRLANQPWDAGAGVECMCCAHSHDPRPEGVSSCGFCATALFLTSAKWRSSRWGGWRWLGEGLRSEAVLAARRDPELALRADALSDDTEDADEHLGRVARLGGDPWHGDWLGRIRAGIRPVGTIYLPVPVLETDLKTTVELRTTAILSELWSRAKLKTPRNTGETEARSIDADRFLHWLWQNRVEGHSLADIGTPKRLRRADSEPQFRAVREGVRIATETLH